jgi:hypothetical protein
VGTLFISLDLFAAPIRPAGAIQAGLPRVKNFNDLNCQTSAKVQFDPQRVFPALSNLIVERNDGRFQICLRCDAPGKFERRAFAEALAGEVRHARTS